MTSLLLGIIYIAFISLGLPDGILGASWPSIYPDMAVPVSYAGIVSMTIAAGTILSSLCSDRLTVRLGTAAVTALSVAMTAIALFGFSVSTEFWHLCLWAIPYGLGAGSVDAALNNYVALHYESRHMSWLHCMWGVGASIGPYIIGAILTGGGVWNSGYRTIGILQLVLTAIIVFSLPLWQTTAVKTGDSSRQALSLAGILAVPGAKAAMICFFCYCALEQTAALWATSYLQLNEGLPAETAASLGGMFFLGITVGRAVSGFVTMRLNDTQMVHLGFAGITSGVVLLMMPLGPWAAIVGLLLVGLGCAPIYPAMLHATPQRFGAENSQAIFGVQMASAYVGSCLAPALFGLVARHIAIALMPVYLLAILVLMVAMFCRLGKKT